MNRKLIITSLIFIIIFSAIYLFTREPKDTSRNTENNVTQPKTQEELVKFQLTNGTPEEKEKVLADFLANIEKFKISTISQEEQTDISSIAPYIPSIIEAILDGTVLPRHGDTGWGNVYHYAATVLSTFAYKIDGTQRNRDSRFSFYDSVGTADEATRKSVHDNWLKWWDDNKGKLN